jgi:hypothetical protein
MGPMRALLPQAWGLLRVWMALQPRPEECSPGRAVTESLETAVLRVHLIWPSMWASYEGEDVSPELYVSRKLMKKQ